MKSSKIQVLSTKPFGRRARKLSITDEQLCEAARSIRHGEADADLGGGLFKQRIARKGEGKSGGFRVVPCLRHDDIRIFLAAYAKKNKANLSHEEEKAIKTLATKYLSMSREALATALREGELFEISRRAEGAQDSATQATD